ncbi:MAG: hypothetical protein NT072_00540 [Deltaproteobacteria bacterium]|nr:hypothetical protein [Deltaproteobacteria bacterium]
MKRATIIVIAILCAVCVAAVGFAQTKAAPPKAEPAVQVIKGKVLSIDAAKKEVTVKLAPTGKEEIIKVTDKDLALLKVDDEIKATLKAGTNEVIKIKVMPTPQPKKK